MIASGAGRGASSTLHVLSSGALTEAYIEDLKLFRFSTHPKIAPKIEEMKTDRAAKSLQRAVRFALRLKSLADRAKSKGLEQNMSSPI